MPYAYSTVLIEIVKQACSGFTVLLVKHGTPPPPQPQISN